MAIRSVREHPNRDVIVTGVEGGDNIGIAVNATNPDRTTMFIRGSSGSWVEITIADFVVALRHVFGVEDAS